MDFNTGECSTFYGVLKISMDFNVYEWQCGSAWNILTLFPQAFAVYCLNKCLYRLL